MSKPQSFDYPASLEDALFSFRPTVVLVDMQTGFMPRFISEDVPLRIALNQKRVIDHCATYDLPLAILEYEDRGLTLGYLKTAAERVPRKEYFTKFDDDGFTSEPFRNQLQEWNSSYLFFMGMTAGACVLDTAITGHYVRGYKVMSAECVIGSPLGRLEEARNFFLSQGHYYV